ncbi:VOC family protein [Streptomyces sp. NPDC001796]|uniref:VOC family protein n=1 Tax=Streptomyces sp. NPDC001796 TaxID=3364609 RepID=UPI0036930758
MAATLDWKLVVDTHDAPALADFWAAALGYEVEDNSALIDRLLTAGQLPEAAVAEHNGTRIFRGFAAIRHPDDPYDKETGIGRGRRILFQDVPEPKTAKNRLHLDVHAGPGAREATVARLEALGASRVEEVNKGPAGHWWVMRDPEGNEFCVA